MKFLFLSLCLLLSFNLFAQNFTKGVGHFYAHQDDKHEFIKKQLIYEGFKSIISKELEKMGLNKEVFWQKYDEGLNERFSVIEEDLKVKMRINEKSSKTQLKRFKDKFRKKKLRYRIKYGSLGRVISRYSIKKMTRSQENAQSRSIRLEGVVNSRALSKTYYKFVSLNKSTKYGNLYLNINYVLDDITYTELGVENENDFSEVIQTKWIDWFNQNKPGNISSVVELSSDNQIRLNEYLKLPSDKMLTNIPEMFINSLLLDIEVRIQRVRFDKRKNQYEFKYSGAGYLKELQTNMVVQTYDFNQEVKKYLITENVNLANIIVNHIYRMALGSFPQIISSVKNITNINSVQYLNIENYANMYEVIAFVDEVTAKGIRYSLRTHINNIGKNSANIILFYDGKKTDIKDLLMALQSAKKDQSFEFVEQDNAFSIKFNKMAIESKKQI